MFLQRGHRVSGEVHGLPSVGGAELQNKVFDQSRDIFAAFAQRGQAQGEDEDAVK